MLYQLPMVMASRTVTQPVLVCHEVSRTSVPGRYRRPAGTMTSAGPRRKPPADRSRMAPNTLGLSGRGRHIHSTLPLGATRALDSRSERNAYSAMGGKGLRPKDPSVPLVPKAWGKSSEPRSGALKSSVDVPGF